MRYAGWLKLDHTDTGVVLCLEDHGLKYLLSCEFLKYVDARDELTLEGNPQWIEIVIRASQSSKLMKSAS